MPPDRFVQAAPSLEPDGEKRIRDLKESSSLFNPAADLLSLACESTEEDTSRIIVDLVKRARDLVESTGLLEESQD